MRLQGIPVYVVRKTCFLAATIQLFLSVRVVYGWRVGWVVILCAVGKEGCEKAWHARQHYNLTTLEPSRPQQHYKTPFRRLATDQYVRTRELEG